MKEEETTCTPDTPRYDNDMTSTGERYPDDVYGLGRVRRKIIRVRVIEGSQENR